MQTGSVIERDQSHLEEYEVFRARWPGEMERLRRPLADEWAALNDCFR